MKTNFVLFLFLISTGKNHIFNIEYVSMILIFYLYQLNKIKMFLKMFILRLTVVLYFKACIQKTNLIIFFEKSVDSI